MASLERRQALLVEARRKRNAFVESARDGSGGAPVRGGSATAVGAAQSALPSSSTGSGNSASCTSTGSSNTSASGGSSSRAALAPRPDSAVELLVDSGVTASLPSATTLLEFLSEATTAAAAASAHGSGSSGVGDKSGGYGDLTLDTPIGSMEAAEVPVPTHARMPGATPYEVLLAKLKHPNAGEVVKALERFIAHVDANVDVVKLWETSAPSNASSSGGDFLNQDHSSNSGNANVMQGSWRRDLPESDLPPVMVGSFLNRMYRLMRDCPLWCPAMEPVADGTWNKTKVAAESFLYRKLRHKLFGVTAEDVMADAAIAARIDSLGFLTPKHLDIKSLKGLEDKDGEALDWSLAVQRLRRMAQESGPCAKIDEIVACSREITKVLTVALGGDLPGADDFLPAMIYVLKTANPPQLASNLMFIQEYCPKERLMSEAGYIFTHLASAVAFLTDLSPDQLTDVSPQQFAQSLRECAAAAADSTSTDEGTVGNSKAMRLLPARSMALSQSRRARLWSDDNDDTYKSSDSPTSRYRGSSNHGDHTNNTEDKSGGGLSRHGGTSPRGSSSNRRHSSSSSTGQVEESAALSVGHLRELSVVELRRARRMRERRPNSSSMATIISAVPSEQSTLPHHGQRATAATAEECRARYRYLAYDRAEDLSLKEVGGLLTDYKALAALCEVLLEQREEAKAAELARLELDQPAFVAARRQRQASAATPESQNLETSAPNLDNQTNTQGS